MDRLIALVLLRWRLEMRALRRARASARSALLLVLPGCCSSPRIGARRPAASRVRSAGRAPTRSCCCPGSPRWPPLVGLFWMLSPLLAGLAIAETHDVSRLLHFPIPRADAGDVVAARQPVAAHGAGRDARSIARPGRSRVAGSAARACRSPWPASLLELRLHPGRGAGGGARCCTAPRATAALQDLATLRRASGMGFVIGLLPLILLWGGARPLAAAARVRPRHRRLRALALRLGRARGRARRARRPRRASPSRGGRALLAIGAPDGAVRVPDPPHLRGASSTWAAPPCAAAARARMRFAGRGGRAVREGPAHRRGAIPALKATLFIGLMGPLLFVFFLLQGVSSRRQPRAPVPGRCSSASPRFGSNAFGLERRGIALLMGFPVERWRILLGKNLGAILFRLPGPAHAGRRPRWSCARATCCRPR